MTETTTQTGRVIANYGAELILADPAGNYLKAAPLKKLGLIVCGDEVSFETVDSRQSVEQPIRVTAVQPRSSTLARTDRRKQAKAIAANVTQLIAVTAPKPPFDPLLIDRYSVASRHIGVELLVVINKTDLLDHDTEAAANSLEKIYSDIGYQVIRCSTEGNTGLQQLTKALESQVSILVGQSGVGKSSLLNRLLPDIDTKTGALSEISGLGKHTTTVTTWYDLPSGGAIIDSAGVRQFALDHLSEIDVQAGFKEISDLSMDCKFNDCKHVHEPECAVLEGLRNNAVARQRYDHFLAMRQKET